MGSEQQYIDLYKQCRTMIHEHSSDVMNSVRDEAFERFAAAGFPSRKVERYKYTDIQKLFAPDYGLNLNRLTIPVDPYNAFRCDVPNLSTSLYFVVNDVFYHDDKPKGHLPEGVIIGSLKEQSSHLYNQLAGKANDATTDLNTMLAQDGLYVYVPKNIKVDRAIQVINILRLGVGARSPLRHFVRSWVSPQPSPQKKARDRHHDRELPALRSRRDGIYLPVSRPFFRRNCA